MLLSTLTLASLALAGVPLPCPNPSTQHYTLNMYPNPGVIGMQPLQIRGTSVVYGLTQGFSQFKISAVGDNLADVISAGQGSRELYAGDNGKLTVNANPSKVGAGYLGGWTFEGDGPVKTVKYYGMNQWYSCGSTSDPLHGGQEVYVKRGDYVCPNPVKFTVGATLE